MSGYLIAFLVSSGIAYVATCGVVWYHIYRRFLFLAAGVRKWEFPERLFDENW